MKMWPPHPNTTTNQKIICSKSYYSVSEVSSNMSAISRYFYEGLGVNSGSEIVFLAENRQNGDLQLQMSPLVTVVQREVGYYRVFFSGFLRYFLTE